MPARTKTKEIKPKEKGVDTEEDVRVAFSLSASKKAFDPTLASLFSSSVRHWVFTYRNFVLITPFRLAL